MSRRDRHQRSGANPRKDSPGHNAAARSKQPSKEPASKGWPKPVAWLGALLGLVMLGMAGRYLGTNGPNTPPTPAAERYKPRKKGTLTFARHVAPIIFTACAPCHRPQQSAPFSLLTYDQVRKHARQIAQVTEKGYMPPWPPEAGHGDFADSRRLTTEQIGIIQQWVEEGAIEGDPTDLPPVPTWSETWELGQPDVVVEMPQPYTLPAEGKDVYRNFVFPIPLASSRYVRGVEFRAGNPKVVHHAFVNIDETRQSRHLAGKHSPPGFDGMDLPESAVMPGGQLMGWQPGKIPSLAPDGLSWLLKPQTDLVLQLHMQPGGKPEEVRPAVAFYFTDHPPTNVPFRIKLTRFDFEIPAGVPDFAVEQSYVLPVDVRLLRVLPHAHYLGKDLQGYAVLPTGAKKWLIRIKDWDFKWQGDYGYTKPVALPKGTRLVMHYIYDNSTNNVRNPNQPPKNVQQGPQTTDEMAGLVFQALTDSPSDRGVLAKDYIQYFIGVSIDYYRYRLQRNPNDGEAHTKLGRALVNTGRASAGIAHLLSAVRINPANDKAHYELGYAYLLQNRLAEAFQEFQTVVRIDPEDYQAFGNLGMICLTEGRLPQARGYLETALRLNPDDSVARANLGKLTGLQ